VVVSLLVLGAAGLHRTDLAVEELTAYAGPSSRFVEIDGMRVHYRDRGDGPAVLLLHGSNASLHTWEDWTEALVGAHRVVSVDLPGHGLTGPDPQERYATRDMVAFIDAFADAVGLERFALVGSSMGGRIAWATTVLHPERVDGLVLVSASGFPADGPPRFVYRVARLPVLGAVLTKLTPRWLIAAQLRSAVADPGVLSEGDVDRYADLLRREGNRAAVRTRLLTDPDDEDLRARLGEIAVPTLILWGEQDTWVPVAHAERFASAIPDASVIVYPDLGHLPMEEDPAGTVGDLTAFLEALRP
jgi:pimeloyl-ACP methyl ester carboxylesterase